MDLGVFLCGIPDILIYTLQVLLNSDMCNTTYTGLFGGRWTLFLIDQIQVVADVAEQIRASHGIK